jgi:hypothetical protein
MPHMGTNEGFSLVTFDYHPDDDLYTYTEEAIVNGSSENSGIKWNPIEVINEFHTISASSLPFAITPQYIFVLFRKVGIDLTGFVSDSAFIIPEEKEETIKESVRLFMFKREKQPFHPESL